MNQSLYTGFASSLSTSKAIDVVGNNVANINTIGYKGQNAEFSTLFEGILNTAANDPAFSNTGIGARVSSTSLDTTQGSFQQSANTFNMAIEGDGWFGVANDTAHNT